MTSSSEMDAARYLETLKGVLRDRQITYAQVAEQLDCSLPTVKRVLNKTSVPFDRLLQLCEVARISFGELHSLAERRRPRHYVFSAEQDQLFADRREFLTYFRELAVEGLNPSQIARRHGLDSESTQAYLQGLTAVGLIEKEGKYGATLLVQPPFGFGPDSRVLRMEHAAFMQGVLTDVVFNASSDSAVILKPLHLTVSDYEGMITAFEDVIDRFSAISERAMQSPLRSWQVALAVGPRREPVSESLPRIAS